MKLQGQTVSGKADVSVHAGGDLKTCGMAVNAEAVSYGSIVGNIALDADL